MSNRVQFSVSNRAQFGGKWYWEWYWDAVRRGIIPRPSNRIIPDEMREPIKYDPEPIGFAPLRQTERTEPVNEWITLPNPPFVTDVATGFYRVHAGSTSEAYSFRLVHSGRVYHQHVTSLPMFHSIEIVIAEDVAPRDGWVAQECRTPIPSYNPWDAMNSFWDTEWQTSWEDDRWGDE